VRLALDRQRMDRDLARLQDEVERRYDARLLLGISPRMEVLKSALRKLPTMPTF